MERAERKAAEEERAKAEAAAKARREQEEAERERANEERLAAAAREAEEHEKAAREQEEAERREHEAAEQVEHVDEKFLEPPPPRDPEPEPEPEPPAPPVHDVVEEHLPPVLPRSTTAPAKMTVATRLPQPPNILIMEYAKLGVGGLLACILLCGWRACRRCRSKRRQSGEITITKRAPSPVVKAAREELARTEAVQGRRRRLGRPRGRLGPGARARAARRDAAGAQSCGPARQPARQPARSARPQLGGGATPARSAAAAPPSRPATTAAAAAAALGDACVFPRPFFTVRRPDRAARRRRRWRRTPAYRRRRGFTTTARGQRGWAEARCRPRGHPAIDTNNATKHRHRLARGLGRAARGAAARGEAQTRGDARAGAAGVLLRRGRRLGRERRPRRHSRRRLGRRLADSKSVSPPPRSLSSLSGAVSPGEDPTTTSSRASGWSPSQFSCSAFS